MPSAFVLTISDRSARGERADTSGDVLAERLRGLGFEVARGVVADERAAIVATVREAAPAFALIVTTGGTGLTARDVTPQALRELLDYEVPGFGELMRAEGLRHTAFAALSRSLAGVVGSTLVVAVPGSPKGAAESLDAVAAILPHALEMLAGQQDHERQLRPGSDAGSARAGERIPGP